MEQLARFAWSIEMKWDKPREWSKISGVLTTWQIVPLSEWLSWTAP